jgi:predicted metal-binding protein
MAFDAVQRRNDMPRGKANLRPKEFDFLLEEAKRLGAHEAKIISPNKVVVEDRVLLKCRFGCHNYGRKFVCPPFTPTPDQFRKMLKEYGSILVVKFPADAEADEEVGRSLLRNQYSSDTPPEVKDRTKKFMDAWDADKRRILLAMLDLEKAAFNRGYPLAVALTAGSCTLCEKCNVQGTCNHPTTARCCEHALGVNVKKTLKNIGMSVKFPFEKNPEGIGMLLID